MTSSPAAGLLVLAFDEGIELPPVDPPHPAAPYLDRRQVPGADEGIGLRNADVEVRRNVFEGEEPGFTAWLQGVVAGGAARPRHDITLAKLALFCVCLSIVPCVCCRSSLLVGSV
jgi:hypothetical protein